MFKLNTADSQKEVSGLGYKAVEIHNDRPDCYSPVL